MLLHSAHSIRVGIRTPYIGSVESQPPNSLHSFYSLFGMLQLRTPAFIFAAVAGSVSALGPRAGLPIVNKHIAPDGFPRVWAFRHCCQILCLIEWYPSQCHPRRGLIPWSNNLRKKGEV